MALTLRSLPLQSPTRRRAILKISPQIFLQMCQPTLRPHYFRVVENPLPADVSLVGIAFDGRLITLGLESAEFDEVPEAVEYPELPSPVFREIVIEEDAD